MGFGKDGRGVIIKEDNAIALSTLPAQTAILMPAVAVTEDFRMLKSEIHCLLDDVTAGEGGRLVLGLACAEMTLAEVTESIELNGPLDRNDRVAMEQAERPVWILGGFPDADQQVGAYKMFEWKKRWTFSNDEGWNFFVYNLSNSVMTTGCTVRIKATHYGVWLS